MSKKIAQQAGLTDSQAYLSHPRTSAKQTAFFVSDSSSIQLWLIQAQLVKDHQTKPTLRGLCPLEND